MENPKTNKVKSGTDSPDKTGIDTHADKTGTDAAADKTQSKPNDTKFDKPVREQDPDTTGIDTNADKTKK
jgi:hypothetical protein